MELKYWILIIFLTSLTFVSLSKQTEIVYVDKTEIVYVDKIKTEYITEYIEKCSSSECIDLHQPTRHELTQFLAHDQTDKRTYTTEITAKQYGYETYVCRHYSRDLILNAHKKGIYACLVLIVYDDINHAIVVFSTAEGRVFIEPQNDNIILEPRQYELPKWGSVKEVLIYGGC